MKYFLTGLHQLVWAKDRTLLFDSLDENMDFQPPSPCFWYANDIYHPCPIFTSPVFTNFQYICKDHVGANSFFCSVIYMLKVPDRGRRELGDDSLPAPHFKVIFGSAPPPYLKGLNKQRPQLPEGLVIVAAT